MDVHAFRIAALLLIVGVAGYFHTGQESFTALIPAILGLVIALLAVWGRASSKKGLALSIGALVALAGVGGAGPRVLDLMSLGDLFTIKGIYMLASVALCIAYILLLLSCAIRRKL